MDLYLVVMDETEHWDADFLKQYGVQKMFGTYLYDKRRVVHCCELTGSYELHFLESVPDAYPEDDVLSDKLNQEILQACCDPQEVRYYHCNNINRMERIKRGQLKNGQYFYGRYKKPEDVEEDELEYVIEHYRGNPDY